MAAEDALNAVDTPHPHPGDAIAVPDQADQRGAVQDVRAGRRGGVEHHRVQHSATWRVQGVHARARPDRDLDGLARVVEQRAVHLRRACGAHGGKEPPAVQLHDPGTHERMRGHGVGAAARAVDDCDAQAGAGQEQGGAGTGNPAPTITTS